MKCRRCELPRRRFSGTAFAVERQSTLGAIRRLDSLAAKRSAVLSIGSVLTDDRADASVAAWALVGANRPCHQFPRHGRLRGRRSAPPLAHDRR